MRSLLIAVLTVLTLVPAYAQMPLLKINSKYRVVNIQRNEHGVGVALLDADPNVEQNFVFFTLDSKINLDIIRADGSRKTFPTTLDKFWQRVKVGDIVKVHGARDWDGTIEAESIWLETHDQ